MAAQKPYGHSYRLVFWSIFLIVMVALLFLYHDSLARDNPPRPASNSLTGNPINLNQCSKFNNVTLQFAIAQKGMQAPLSLEEIQQILGPGKVESTAVMTTYTWIYKDRILLVKTINGDLADKMLTGKNDGSPKSITMEQIYEKLKTATSVWIIPEIKKQLGSGNNISGKLQNYSWYCGIGTLTIAVDQNNQITTATISFRSSSKETIEAQLGFTHPNWDIITDTHLGMFYRAWQRSF